MAEIELGTNPRAWGNSYGIVIPAARKLHRKPGEKVHVRLSHDLPRNDAERSLSFTDAVVCPKDPVTFDEVIWKASAQPTWAGRLINCRPRRFK